MTTSQRDIHTPAYIEKTQRSISPVAFCAAGMLELLYLLLVALSALPQLRFNETPLTQTQLWQSVMSAWVHMFIIMQAPRVGALLLRITFLFLMVSYVLALLAVVRQGTPPGGDRRWLLLLLSTTALFGLTLLLQPKIFSEDVFTYIFSGRMLVHYHVDPFNTVPAQFPNDPYLTWVVAGRDTPNIYGPLWLCLVSMLVSFGGSPVLTFLLFKGVMLAAHLLNCLLIWSILGRVAPNRRVLGTLLYAWNPLIVIELAGSGHSDGLLLMLLLLAVWLHLRGPGMGWQVGALLAFGFALSMSFITLLIAPLYIWFVLRTEHRAMPLLWGATWRAALLLLPAFAISAPFWRGASTFFAITSAIDMQHFIHSPVGTLAVPLRAIFQFIAEAAHFPPFLQPEVAADITLRASATFIFALIYVDLFGRVRRTSSPPLPGLAKASSTVQAAADLDPLFSAWGIAVFAYLGLASGWFWPWYLLWMLWIFALRRFDALSSAVILLSGTALILYPLLGAAQASITTYLPAIIFGIPLAYLIIVKVRDVNAERTITSHDG